MNMQPHLVDYERRLPRYTSYPTATQFTDVVGHAKMASWLAGLADNESLSLYFHVPFCHQMCWFCGCSTSVVQRTDIIDRYVSAIKKEIVLVSDAIGKRLAVRQIHWGGGTPSTLSPHAMLGIIDELRKRFFLDSDVEMSVEVDPRHLAAASLEGFRSIGVTRASLGVQDFAPMVQAAIGRVQSFAQTKAASTLLRDAGARSINLDLIYGLPYQTVDSLLETLDQALEISPDRIALYGYAHVPWIRGRQKLIPDEALPDAGQRYAQQIAAAQKISAAGYQPIGLDHFAKPADSLYLAYKAGKLRRNFQGYAVDDATTLIGFGASSISSMPLGYAQNFHKVADYLKAIEGMHLATARGVVLTKEDFLRRAIIERLMCDLVVDAALLCKKYGLPEATLANAMEQLDALVADGVIVRTGHNIMVTSEGRPFVRYAAAAFDAYVQPSATHHAVGV